MGWMQNSCGSLAALQALTARTGGLQAARGLIIFETHDCKLVKGSKSPTELANEGFKSGCKGGQHVASHIGGQVGD